MPRIDDLPTATSVTGTDLIPILQGGITKQATVSLISTGDGDSYLDQCNQYVYGQATTEISATPSGGTYTPNACSSNVHRLVLTQDVTIGIPTNALSGQVMNFIIVQDAVGGWAITWNNIYYWPGGEAPTITVSANAVDVVTMQYDATRVAWYCVHNPDFRSPGAAEAGVTGVGGTGGAGTATVTGTATANPPYVEATGAVNTVEVTT